MGRSVNSFTHWVGHALEINDDKVTLPEKDLWVAVLSRAALDACNGSSSPKYGSTIQYNS